MPPQPGQLNKEFTLDLATGIWLCWWGWSGLGAFAGFQNQYKQKQKKKEKEKLTPDISWWGTWASG